MPVGILTHKVDAMENSGEPGRPLVLILSRTTLMCAYAHDDTLSICTKVTKPRQNPMTPAPINTPQIIPTADRVNDAPSGGENNPLTNAGEIRATTEAKAPPTTADSRAAPRT